MQAYNQRKEIDARERKKRKRRTRAAIKKAREIHKQNDTATGHSRDVILYKQMARHYWDRWQWELQKQKESTQHKKDKVCMSPGLYEIDPLYLMNPVKDGQSVEIYLGQGSFSIVQLKIYRGINRLWAIYANWRHIRNVR